MDVVEAVGLGWNYLHAGGEDFSPTEQIWGRRRLRCAAGQTMTIGDARRRSSARDVPDLDGMRGRPRAHHRNAELAPDRAFPKKGIFVEESLVGRGRGERGRRLRRRRRT
jgi:hypothetical protein